MGAVRFKHRRLAGAAHPPFEMSMRPTARPLPRLGAPPPLRPSFLRLTSSIARFSS
jgi:hypothetical protein